MKQTYQTIHGPEGNCLRASLASILELRLDDVPNFAAMKDDPLAKFPTHWLEMQSWLKKMGYCFIEMALTSSTPLMPMPWPPLCLFFGKTAAGINHCVVGCINGVDLVQVWNPEPTAELVGVGSLGFIMPLDPVKMGLKVIEFNLNTEGQ